MTSDEKHLGMLVSDQPANAEKDAFNELVLKLGMIMDGKKKP